MTSIATDRSARRGARIAAASALVAAAAVACAGRSQAPEARGTKAGVLGFDREPAGALPEGWRAGTTMPDGPTATWRIAAEPGAPSPPNALAATNHRSARSFNLCWTDRVRFRDGEIDVAFRAVSGEEDQGGGPAWRVRDASNYYLCRANPLERNFRVYVVKDGVRKQLASADVEVAPGQWHTLSVRHRGERIECSFNGRRLLEASDAALPAEGGVGLWTKADAVTSFDDLAVRPDA